MASGWPWLFVATPVLAEFLAFIPAIAVPYVIAIVELVEQPGLRMMTNVTGCDPDEVRIGMPVHAVFVPFAGRDDIAAPHFQPDSAAK